MSKPDNVIISKLGKTRAGERSRIWLEGRRLAAHGFIKGAPFAVVRDGTMRWRIEANAGICTEELRALKMGVVSGTPERPIIDTVGALVRDTFGAVGPTVRCTFYPGMIVIEAINERDTL